MEQKKVKKKKGSNWFNRVPINPPKGWKDKIILPNSNFRAINK